jgi:PKD repeat protein
MRLVRILAAAALPVALSVGCGSDNGADPSGVLALTCSAAPESGDAPLDVKFTATSQGVKTGDVRYSWSFGDGTADSGANVTRRYIVGGVYEATVTARAGGQTATCKKTITVGGDLRIDGCYADPDAGPHPLDVRFDVKPVGGARDYSYAWDLGDGGSSTEKNPQHTYVNNGKYNAQVTVQSGTSSARCSTVVEVVDRVSLNCSAAPLSGAAPLGVEFDAKAKGGNGHYDYEWNFGDGGKSSSPSASHTYLWGGDYNAEVRVSAGDHAECSQLIKVSGPRAPVPGPTPAGTPGPGGSPTPTPGGPTPTPTPGGPTPTPTPVQTLFSFTSMDVPKGANAGAGCANGIPCIISTISVSGVTGRIVFMRVGFQATFPDASETNVHLYGQGYPGRDERAAFDGYRASGVGWGSSCSINPRGSYGGPGATTWDDEAPGYVGAGGSPYNRSYMGGLSPGLSYLAGELNTNPGDINGLYTLVIDRWTAAPITTETLNCWTLEIWTVP